MHDLNENFQYKLFNEVNAYNLINEMIKLRDFIEEFSFL